jgi:hypothetical protein
MKNFFVLLAAAASLTSFAQNFNFASYQPTSLAETVKKWDDITRSYAPGFSVLSPQKIALSVTATSEPFSCSSQTLAGLLRMHMMEHLLQLAPTSHCIKVKETEGGREFVLHIQDVLVPSYVAEVKTGSPVRIYAIFFAYGVSKDRANNFPILLVGEFQSL